MQVLGLVFILMPALTLMLIARGKWIASSAGPSSRTKSKVCIGIYIAIAALLVSIIITTFPKPSTVDITPLTIFELENTDLDDFDVVFEKLNNARYELGASFYMIDEDAPDYDIDTKYKDSDEMPATNVRLLINFYKNPEDAREHIQYGLNLARIYGYGGSEKYIEISEDIEAILQDSRYYESGVYAMYFIYGLYRGGYNREIITELRIKNICMYIYEHEGEDEIGTATSRTIDKLCGILTRQDDDFYSIIETPNKHCVFA